jgi:phytoene dehydrogenase-like protein
MGRCESTTGIVPFTALVDQVMNQEPYKSAKRVFWIVDSGSSHKGVAAQARLRDHWSALPNRAVGSWVAEALSCANAPKPQEVADVRQHSTVTVRRHRLAVGVSPDEDVHRAVVVHHYVECGAAIDPGRVPTGRSSLKIILTTVPYAVDWHRRGEPYARSIVDTIGRCHIPDLDEKILGLRVMTPLDYEADLASAVRGTVTHGAMTPDQQGANRPSPELSHYRGPVEGLYLCGAGSHPGPGVSMMPGRTAARVILDDAAQRR